MSGLRALHDQTLIDAEYQPTTETVIEAASQAGKEGVLGGLLLGLGAASVVAGGGLAGREIYLDAKYRRQRSLNTKK